MRLAFLGTPDFAVASLRALHAAGHDIVAVYCQPPRPSGRGQAVRRCPVQVAAEALGLAVRTPASLRRDPAVPQSFISLGLDAAVVAAYGLLLPETMLAAPRRGCINVHASLLPRWRGAAPIQAAILAGDAHTGVTIMQMDTGLDTGPMLLQAAVPIGPATTATDLHDRLAVLGADLVLRVLAGSPQAVPQPGIGVTYAAKLTRADGELDWRQDAATLARRVRALNPWPGTVCRLDGQSLKVLAASVADGHGEPGVTLDDGLLVAAGGGALRLEVVQAAGRGALPAAAFLRGRPVPSGTRLS